MLYVNMLHSVVFTILIVKISSFTSFSIYHKEKMEGKNLLCCHQQKLVFTFSYYF